MQRLCSTSRPDPGNLYTMFYFPWVQLSISNSIIMHYIGNVTITLCSIKITKTRQGFKITLHGILESLGKTTQPEMRDKVAVKIEKTLELVRQFNIPNI